MCILVAFAAQVGGCTICNALCSAGNTRILNFLCGSHYHHIFFVKMFTYTIATTNFAESEFANKLTYGSGNLLTHNFNTLGPAAT
jgi:hypothetical protein